jgi:hypothetical protein
MGLTKKLFEELIFKQTTDDYFFYEKIHCETLEAENEHEIVRQ